MKIKKLRRALAVLLSAAMLIMCMPTVGITAAAVDDTTQCVYATITGTEDITTLSEVPAGTTWSDTVNLTAALAKANTAHDGDTVYIKLLSDVNKTNYGTYIQFSYSSGNVVLDLNGHTIDRGLTSATNGGKGIYISASDVMCITSSNGMGTITGGYESANEGSAIYSNSATKTIFSNIKISGNKNSGSRFGFSVIVRNGATVLDNVEITGNTDTGSAIVGGGIMTYYSNTLKNKVIIRDNSKYNFYCDLSSNAPLDISELSDDSEVCIFTDSMYSGRDITTGNPEKISLLKFDLTGYWLIPTVNGRITFTNSKYGVTFDMQGKADNQYKNVTKGGTVTKPTDPTAEGFTFGGWYTDKDCTDEFNFTTPITQNTTVYAKWEAPAGITITLDPNYTDAATSTATADEEGKLTEAQLAAPTRKDYVFMGWYDAKEGGKKVTADTVFTEDTTIYAQWVYYKLDNNIYTTLDEVKKQDIVKDMIDGETFDSVDLSGLFTINENSNCLTLSAVLTDKDEKTSGTYVGGEKYYALVTIKPETGFIFENIYNTRLFIGKTSYLSYNEDTTNNCVQFVYPIGRADFNYEEIVIDEVQVNVDTSKLDLIANEAIDPEAVYSCFSVPDEVEYDVYLDGVAYKDEEGNYQYANLDDGDTYTGGKEYYAKLAVALPAELSVIYIYSFADDVTITFGDGSIPFDVSDRGTTWIEGFYPIGTASDPISGAAQDIDRALDDLKPTNDTFKDDVQKIVDDKKGNTTATVTTFELTPATTEKEGSLKVIVTVSYGSNKETVTKTYTIDKLAEEGDIVIDNSGNYSGAGIANAEEAKSVIPLENYEKAAIESGEDLYIILDVKDGTATVPTSDRTVVNSTASEYGLTVGMMLDIELFKRIGDGGLITAVHETNGMLTVEFKMPAELLNSDADVTRTYKIIRVHNGVPTVLDCDFDPATGIASFKTDKFSTYAIAYSDVSNAVPAPEAPKYAVDLGTDGRVHANKTSAAAGDTITISVDPGYIAHVFSGNTEIARITSTGTFVMPANGIKVVVECELGHYMLTKARSYVYSYDSGMNRIAVSATKNQKNTVTVNLGKDYAGKSFTVYEGKKSTSVKVTDGTLDANGKITLEVDFGKNYTLVVEE